jgi:long-chain acyl-CoA synthetase
LDPLTVWQRIELSLRRVPDQIALCGPDGELTFSELEDQVNRATQILADINVNKGTVVAASTGNCFELIVAFLATMRLGACWVGLNVRLALSEKERLIEHAGARVFLTDPIEEPDLRRLRGANKGSAVFTTGIEHDLSWSSALKTVRARPFPEPRIDPSAPATIMYTSGTTGRPRGVVHSQHNIALPALYLSNTPDFADGTRTGVCLPITVTNVLILGPLAALFAGVPTVLIPQLRAVTVADWVARERITSMTIPPPIVYDLCTRDDIAPDALDVLEYPRSGGSYLPSELGAQYSRRFGRRIVRTYGLTEVPTLVTVEDRNEAHVPGSSGIVVPYLKVAILDTKGNSVSCGTDGEICVLSATEGPWAGIYKPMLGYWPADIAATKRVLRTGDIGHLDATGNLFITDRIKNVILRGGASVYPSEVEKVISRLPGVVACVVIGVPDERLGADIVAVIEATEDRRIDGREIIAACHADLSSYKVPKTVYFVPELPRGIMGKIDRIATSKLVRGEATRSIRPSG